MLKIKGVNVFISKFMSYETYYFNTNRIRI